MTPPIPIGSGTEFTARQQEILSGLESLFLSEGFRKFTVGDLAERVQCSRRTLYELAPSKDELVLLVLDSLLQRMGKQARQRVAALTNPVEQVRAFVDAGVTEIRSASHTFARDVADHPGARRLFDAHYEYAAEALRRIVQHGIEQGAFRPVSARLVAELFDATVERLQQPRTLDAIGMTEAAAIEQLGDMVLNGIANP